MIGDMAVNTGLDSDPMAFRALSGALPGWMLALFLVFTAASAMAQSASSAAALPTLQLTHCLRQCPQADSGNPATRQIIVRSLYSLLFNSATGTADWVAYQVDTDAAGIASGKSRGLLAEVEGLQSWADRPLPMGEQQFIMGRYAPLLSFAGTPYWDEVNRGANAVPIRSGLARGAWYGLQWAIRRHAVREGNMFVVTGPVFSADPASAPAIPDGFFTLVSDQRGATVAFYLPQAAMVSAHHCSMRTPIQQIETLTGLRFDGLHDAGFSSPLANGLGCQ